MSLVDRYDTGDFYDEMFEPSGVPRAGAALLAERLDQLGETELRLRQAAAERALLTMGITFTVYGETAGTERIFPFDLVPRIVEWQEWLRIEMGLLQRIRALDAFVADVYGEQRILSEGVVPREVVLSSKGYLPACQGLRPPGDIWCHVVGTDLVRDRDGQFYVLEDNLRCPSGASYVLENRAVMKRSLPGVFEASRVMPVDEYPSRLLEMLHDCAPARAALRPTAVLLTPGVYNSAYFEHSFLARQMGIELVEGRDLAVQDDRVWLRTTKGLKPVDTIYRRIDDTFLDPEVFRADSMLGVAGLMRAYRKGNVTLANAPGTGVADDKAVYAYVPRIVKFYLGEEPILPNVPTYLCHEPESLTFVLDNLHELVVKAANESGGYGMLIGPASSRAQRDEFARQIRDNPRNYIAQPTLALSRAPAFVDGKLEGRHVDLRPYVLSGKTSYVMPGGLTRVALKKGSLVVNSSQGGGSKDTWVLYGGRGDAPSIPSPPLSRNRLPL